MLRFLGFGRGEDVVSVLWLQGMCCGGETVSLLNAEQPDFVTALALSSLDLVWHPSFSRVLGTEALSLLAQYGSGQRELGILVVEGAVPHGADADGDATSSPAAGIAGYVIQLAAAAKYVVAAGTCASFGGILSSRATSVRATGLQYLRDRLGGVLGNDFRSRGGLPVVNVSGCPAHPDWLMGTLSELSRDHLSKDDLDKYGRPKVFYAKLAHHGCPRNEYYEFKASALAYSQQGCLFENLGCKGTQCDSDCNERLWLARTGSCPRGGFPCLSCTSPKFPDGFVPFFETQKIGDVPTTLPLDVPKAWYVGISGLAKLASPKRLSRNATSYRPVDTQDEEQE